MTGSTTGKLFKVSTWGESHGEALCCVIEWVPSKIKITDDNFQYVTPGIRLTQNKDDHEQAFTPQDAVKLGASYLVLGRVVSESDNPDTIIKSIIKSID